MRDWLSSEWTVVVLIVAALLLVCACCGHANAGVSLEGAA